MLFVKVSEGLNDGFQFFFLWKILYAPFWTILVLRNIDKIEYRYINIKNRYINIYEMLSSYRYIDIYFIISI